MDDDDVATGGEILVGVAQQLDRGSIVVVEAALEPDQIEAAQRVVAAKRSKCPRLKVGRDLRYARVPRDLLEHRIADVDGDDPASTSRDEARNDHSRTTARIDDDT